jgi:hypothetical protein
MAGLGSAGDYIFTQNPSGGIINRYGFCIQRCYQSSEFIPSLTKQ